MLTLYYWLLPLTERSEVIFSLTPSNSRNRKIRRIFLRDHTKNQDSKLRLSISLGFSFITRRGFPENPSAFS